MRISRIISGLSAVALAASLLVLVAAPAQALNFPVSKTADTNDGTCDADCSLREAIVAANNAAGPDSITLPNGEYVLEFGELTINDDLTINGGSQAGTIVNGNSNGRVFRVNGVTATFENMRITNGQTSGHGGGLKNLGGNVTLTNVTIDGNTAFRGGGIANRNSDAVLVAFNTSVLNNGAQLNCCGNVGGGIFNEGTLTFNGGLIEGNTAAGGAINGPGVATGPQGGGVWNAPHADALIQNGTIIRDNFVTGSFGCEMCESRPSNGGGAAPEGGGLWNAGLMELIEVTVGDSGSRGNSAEYGGGIYNYSGDNGAIAGDLVTEDTDVIGNFGLDGWGVYNESTYEATGGQISGNKYIFSQNGFGGPVRPNGKTGAPQEEEGDVYGGGIYNQAGALADLYNVDVLNHQHAREGAGIWNRGTLSLHDGSLVANNQADHEGGGIWNGSARTLNVNDSEVADNTAGIPEVEGGNGAGIWNGFGGTTNIWRSAVVENTAIYAQVQDDGYGGVGGGIWNQGTLSVANSTVSANHADERGGGIYTGLQEQPVEVLNSTVAFNTTDSFETGAGISNTTIGTETPMLRNTIVALNEGAEGSPEDCAGPIDSHGWNIDSDGSCQLDELLEDKPETDPLLGPLAFNGGPTRTNALLEGSPAIDMAEPPLNSCPPPATDQRGAPRPVDGDGNGSAICDIGAYEAGSQPPEPEPNVAPDIVIRCRPRTATNQVGTLHKITCRVERNDDGRPIINEQVSFSETGPGDFVTGSDVQPETDANGMVMIEVTSSEAGTQNIKAVIDKDQDDVEKIWTVGVPPQCSDGLDNDDDGDVDGDDRGCSGPEDDDESDDGGRTEPVVENGPCRGLEEGTERDLPDGHYIVGTPGDDLLVGTRGDDIICGLGGNDVIDGGGGNDIIVGNAGDDTIEGGNGTDNINGNKGDDTIDGGNGNDSIRGSKGDDTMRGNSNADVIRGGSGKDTLQGGSGHDDLFGGGNDDTLKGFTGNDDLDGGGGSDSCDGGPGSNTFTSCEA